ncbi:hypothetical protein [Methylobacterium thuringiense]|uniref:Uncharacterized protein n=1 Tax=Methylobacterium thuringiense TaxID=1003091 RepID=A0ABQ4TLK3_9HYPH|nr:hypothetical protein [Methylobacterium thuringiense]GJE54575.1 hypothetical protein EKPJFOCH_1053 [Methylobacterium thuringiense]
MTLARTALRLAAVATLSGTKAKPATIAENRVFDSRITFIDPKDVTDAQPILIVQTDNDEGDPTDGKDGVSPAGGPPFWRMTDLVIECAMVARGDDGDGGFVIGYPVTDAQLEAQLDFLEWQVWMALAYAPSTIARAFRKTAKLMRYESHRQATDENGDRAAVRVLTFKCKIHDFCPMPQAGATGFDRLPKPLSDVAKALDPESYAGAAVAALADAMSEPDPMPALQRIGMGFDFSADGLPDGVPDLAADLPLSSG